MNFVWARARAIAKKEVYHIVRDPFTLALALGMPILMVLIYGFAMDFNIKNIHMSVSDADQSAESRKLIDTFSSSGYFLAQSGFVPSQVQARVEDENARAGLIIPPRFGADIKAGRGSSIQLLVDGADASSVGPVLGYSNAIQSRAIERITKISIQAPYELRTRFLFNPELNSRWFVVPGLTVVVMAIISVLLTALTVAREWENGSMELLLSTPVEPLEIIIGKLAPYGALGLIALLMVYTMARVVFTVPFQSNHLMYFVGVLLFLVTYLAQGLWISVVTKKQMVAMQFAMLTGFLPSQLLSGFVFPISSMPPFFRYLTMILPARWFMQISRYSYLRGATIWDLRRAFLALSILCAWMIYNATKRFKRDLEP